MEECAENSVSRTIPGEAARYSAPELLENSNSHATNASDAYSFALLILECITEMIPFHEFSRDAAVIHARISKRQMLSRPGGRDPGKTVSDDLWSLMNRCWSAEPDRRPTMEAVHSFFQVDV